MSASEKGHLFFQLCSDHLSIEAIPRTPLKLDLNALKERPLIGYEVMMWTPHFVVLKNSAGHEITLRRNGRMIVRKAASESEAQRAATAVMDSIEQCMINE
ncbi:MAG TPA: hypothetical protein VLV18_09090 [Terriglobales bacterium]|nr:hypothetical protein [Terriglobales bacterium]